MRGMSTWHRAASARGSLYAADPDCVDPAVLLPVASSMGLLALPEFATRLRSTRTYAGTQFLA